MKKRHFLGVALFCVAAITSNAQMNDLLNFTGTNGEDPNGSVLLAGKKLFCVAGGGVHGYGCIFSMDTNGGGYKDIHDFNDSTGGGPVGEMVLNNGVLYGMTASGGAHSAGVVFSIDTNGGNYKDMLDFNGTNGGNPQNSLALAGNVLYGTTLRGGAHDSGCVFSIHTDGSGYRDLFDCTFDYGFYTYGKLTISGNKMYGMAAGGGSGIGDGAIFSLDTNGGGFTDLIAFNGTNGADPQYGALLLSGNVLYGMTTGGGSDNAGAIFSVHTDGTHDTVIHNFIGSDGAYPTGGLKISGNTIVGMTYDGGANFYGNIFSIHPNGTGFVDLYDFDVTHGSYPLGDLTLSGNWLYGMTSKGGSTGLDGVVFGYRYASLGIDKIPSSDNSINLYPNPNNGKFTVQSSGISNQSSVEIYNTLGQLVYSQFTTHNPQFTINLGNQPGGVYLYRVVSENGSLIGDGKFVIDK